MVAIIQCAGNHQSMLAEEAAGSKAPVQ